MAQENLQALLGNLLYAREAPDAGKNTANDVVLKSISASITGATTKTVDIPDVARGFKIYPTDNDVQFAIGEDPAVGTSFDSDPGVGGVAKADQWEVRLLVPGTDRDIRIKTTATTDVVLEFFS